MTLEFSLEPLAALLLAAFRAAVVLFLVPLFSGQGVPAPLRFILAFTLAMVFAPAVSAELPGHWLGWLLLVGRELALGFMLSFFALMFLSIPHLAGDIIAQEMGLRLAQEVDPNTRVPTTAIGSIYQSTLFLVFLAMQGHHDVLRALHLSYQSFPVGELGLPQSLAEAVSCVSLMLRQALVLSAPMFVILLVGSLLMALLAKTVPQLNIMVFGYPLRLLAALFIGASLFSLTLRPALASLRMMKSTLLWLAGA